MNGLRTSWMGWRVRVWCDQAKVTKKQDQNLSHEVPVEKKSVMWRNFSTWQMSLSCVEILHMTDWHVEKKFHMRNVTKICNVENNVHIMCPILHCFFAIYAVLLTNLFCRNLLAFVRKIEQKIVPVEKNDKYHVFCWWCSVVLTTSNLIPNPYAFSEIFKFFEYLMWQNTQRRNSPEAPRSRFY